MASSVLRNLLNPPKDLVHEIEFKDREGPTMVTGKRDCDDSELPSAVLDHLHRLLGAEAVHFQPSRTKRGNLRDEPVFELRGRSSGWGWEFEMTADGRLLELEKERLH